MLFEISSLQARHTDMTEHTDGGTEEFAVSGGEVIQKVKELVAAGNARRISIKNEKGETVLEIPLALGAVGVLLAPALAAIGAVAALMTKCTIVVVKK